MPSDGAAVTSTVPATSTPWRRPAPRCCGMNAAPRARVARPMGRLTKKIQCQLTAWVSAPPTSSPIEPPDEATAEYTLIARAVCRCSRNTPTTMPSTIADAAAPPTPWRKRAAIKSSALGASPQSTEERVNRDRPAVKTRRRPSRSPSRPASRSRPPKAMR